MNDLKKLDVGFNQDDSLQLEREVAVCDWVEGVGTEILSINITKEEALALAETIRKHYGVQ